MYRGLTLLPRYQRPYPIVKSVVVTRSLATFKPIPSFPTPPPFPLPHPVQVRKKPDLTVKKPESFDDQIICRVPCVSVHDESMSQCYSSVPHDMVLTKWMTLDEERPIDWEEIRKMNNLPKDPIPPKNSLPWRPEPPKNSYVAFEWINGEPFPFIVACQGGRQFSHQFMYAFQEMKKKQEVKALRELSYKLHCILEVTMENNYTQPFLQALKNHEVVIIPEVVNLWDVVWDFERCLETDSSNSGHVELKGAFIIKQGLKNYWVQCGVKDLSKKWDVMIKEMVQITIQGQIAFVENEANEIRLILRKKRLDLDNPEIEKDAIDSWNDYMDVKNNLMVLKKKKESLLALQNEYIQ